MTTLSTITHVTAEIFGLAASTMAGLLWAGIALTCIALSGIASREVYRG